MKTIFYWYSNMAILFATLCIVSASCKSSVRPGDSITLDLKNDYFRDIKLVFEEYTSDGESVDSEYHKELMKRSLESLHQVTNKDDLELLLNVWMYYDPTDFPTRRLVYRILKENSEASIIAIQNRRAHMQAWENPDTAPFMELNELETELANRN